MNEFVWLNFFHRKSLMFTKRRSLLRDAWLLIGRLGPTYIRHARSVKSVRTMAECGGGDSSTSSHTMDKSITLPPDEIFRNLENAKRFAIDIGI